MPTLYKKTATGAIQQWAIGVEGMKIVTTFGQVGGKTQTASDSIKIGKNLGRKNATDQETQALSEAKSQWLKKKKAGYVESLEDAESGKIDSVIKGGIVPMTAKVFQDYVKKISYPVGVQPKLDGHRCIAMIDGRGSVSLWTRTRKRITSVPHIEKELERIARKRSSKSLILDGEIYSHSFKDDFEKITSIARKENVSEDSKLLEYHVYDIVSHISFGERLSNLKNLFAEGDPIVSLVRTEIARSLEDVKKIYEDFMEEGYEGAMVRDPNSKYEHKRSTALLKYKEFQDAEFEIIGVKEGRGKLQGHGIFICRVFVGLTEKTFDCKMDGPMERLKEYWENKDEYIGEKLTVQYQGFTKHGKPRFPVGIRIREDL